MNGPLPPDFSGFSVRHLATLYEAIHAASESLLGASADPRFQAPIHDLMAKEAEHLADLADYLARHRDEVARAMEARSRPADATEASVWAAIIVGHELACNGTSDVPELERIADGIRLRNIAEGC